MALACYNQVMARYLFRLAILGPTALSPVQVDAALSPVFERLGLASSDPSIVEVKNLNLPVLLPASEDVDARYAVFVPGIGEVELDGSAAAGAVRVLTRAEILLDGTLPPDGARTGRTQVSDAVFREINLSLPGFFNLSGGARGSGMTDLSSGGSIWPYALTAAVVGGLFAYLGETR